MSSKRYTDILALLVAGRVSSTDLMHFFEQVSERGPSKVLMDLRNIHRQIRSMDLEDEIAASTAISDRQQSISRLMHDATIALSQAGFTAKEAMEKVTLNLYKNGALNDPEALNYRPKDGFSNWFRKAHSLVGGSMLLTAIAQAVQDKEGRPRTDWSLDSE